MSIKKLPYDFEVETPLVLKQAILAERALGELKGIIETVPNQAVLMNTIFLQEAKASSEIENIVTTQDEFFRIGLDDNLKPDTKEVENYNKALLKGYRIIKTNNNKYFTNNNLKEIQSIITNHDAGFRTQMGTTLKDQRGETIYTPPQDAKEIEDLMSNLEKFMNDDTISDLNPLVKMALIHYQFESIHPFYDGNGRVGRIINILYLSLKGLLNMPILYLSRYIIDHKADYYRLLQETRDNQKWEEWILFMLEGIKITAKETTTLIQKISKLRQDYKIKIRENHKNMYSQDLINALFKYPYTKIDFLVDELRVHKNTASKYLKILAENNFLKLCKLGRENYYLNTSLIDLLSHVDNT